MPTLEGLGYRIRLVLGESNGHSSQDNAVWPVTILDGYTDNQAQFIHQVQSGFNTWLYAVEGDIEYQLGGYWASLKQGSSIALTFEQLQQLTVRGTVSKQSHFVVMSGEPIKEAFVQKGPFAMTTQQEIDDVVAKYEAGELGQIGKN